MKMILKQSINLLIIGFGLIAISMLFDLSIHAQRVEANELNSSLIALFK